jgi:hypothetical protein
MQNQSKQWPVAIAIVLAAAMICATLVVLNVRTIYPRIDVASNTLVMDNGVYLRLLANGCTGVVNPAGGTTSVSCPLWVRP